MQEMKEVQVGSLGQEDPLEEEMTTHCSILPWEIPWTEQSGWLQSMGSQRTGHDLVNKQQLKTKYEPAAQRSWGGATGGGVVSKGKGPSVGKLGQRICPHQSYVAVCAYFCHVAT